MNFILHTELCRWLKEQKIGGDREAIFLYKLWEWCEKNEANDKNFHDGRYWSYNSLRGFTRIFPWSKREIETTVNKLRDAGLILTAKLSKDPKDTTLSYTVVTEKIGVSPFGDPLSPNGETVSPGGDNHPSPYGDNPSPNGETLNEHIKTQVVVQANKPEEGANKPSPRQVMDRYNAICTSLSRCIRLTDKRAKAVRQLFAKGYTAEQLTDAFGRAQASSFCTGRNDRGWRADFDWLMNENNLVRVLEGKYGGSASPEPPKPKGGQFEQW
nr:hypothetical protein [uncultured Agathobaculum sp.]